MPNIPDYYAAHSPKSVVPNTAISRVAARLLPIMAAFSSLTDRLSNAFKHLKSKGKLSEADIDGTIREIRRALLDADVALDVVRSFTGKVRERALGTEVSDALNPAQQVVKIVNEELTDVLGQGVDRPLNFAKNPPTIIMLAGLQGAGKTTLAGKLGYWLKDSGHTPLLVAADLQRPNAVTQLQVVGERAGVPVVYGIVGLKTHCKLSLVVRQEADGLRRYCHVGTGNYNPKTARIYTDLGLLTCDPVVGQDMTRLFNQLSGYAPKSSFHRLLVAPRTVRSGLIQRIRREEDAARAGKEAWIKIKVNSIVDEKTIDALYRASQAGVKIDIVERGICALKPGVPGLSENIRVRSILGRFLEHSRIYAFANSDGPQIGEGPAAGPEVWIGSADLMHRNLDRRVEALVRIVAPEQIDELIKYVDLQMADSTASWHMQADGTYVRHCKDEEGRPLVDSQEYLIKKHTRRPVRH
mgnify:CR=1 FL=1